MQGIPEWMEKEALYLPEQGKTPPAVLLERNEGSLGFDKLACEGFLPEVQRFLDQLEAKDDCQYVLVNALGASDYYGKNANHDAFPEAALVNIPAEWAYDPKFDKELAKKCTYGFPTFYNAGCFVHHKNKVHDRRVGDVCFVTWNDRMKRVELVMEIHRQRAMEFGGAGFWHSIEQGVLPAVSMGARVKFDRCSKCTDLDAFYRALKKYDPKRHANPGMAVLEEHMRLRDAAGIPRDAKNRVGGIRGIGRTRLEYCDCMLRHAGEIDPLSGLQIFVYNDFPLFFDISLVFVPADKTALGMKIVIKGRSMIAMPQNSLFAGLVRMGAGITKVAGVSEEVAEALKVHPAGSLGEYIKRGLGGPTVSEAALRHDQRPGTVAGYDPWNDKKDRPMQPDPQPAVSRDSGNVKGSPFEEPGAQKTASSTPMKLAKLSKRGEMDKVIDNETPPQLALQAARGEPLLPKELLNALGKSPLGDVLGTTSSLGIVLRPSEYQRVTLVGMGMGPVADRLDDEGRCFGFSSAPCACPAMRLVSALAELLLPYLSSRSGFSPFLRDRVSIGALMPVRHEHHKVASFQGPLASYLASGYQAYRHELLSKLAEAQAKLASSAVPELHKVAAMEPDELFTPLSFSYLRLVFQDEVASL